MAEDKDPKSDKPAKAKKSQEKSASAKPATRSASTKSRGGRVVAKKPAKKAKRKPAEGAAKARPSLVVGTLFGKDLPQGGKWCLIDASGRTLGRLSSYITLRLMGKMNPAYTPTADMGDHVIVINAEKVKLTGNKLEDKYYYSHSNYPGGIKETKARDVLKNKPEMLIERAVWRMLPKSKGAMAHHWFGKLRVYKGADHPHTAQMPETVTLPNLGMH